MNAWVVRIILTNTNDTLQYGLLQSMQNPAGIVQIHENEHDRQVFDIHRPKYISIKKSKRWAEDVASRMKSFAINAAAAPEWRGEDID